MRRPVSTPGGLGQPAGVVMDGPAGRGRDSAASADPAERGAADAALFIRACTLDVAVRKPGNVSLASPGHGMDAAMFVASAQAAAGPLFRRGASVGERIEAATTASWAAAGCNTNLGIVLLCAPIAAAAERLGPGRPLSRTALRETTAAVLAGLDVDDARAAYRAIALANPGGLGAAPAQDVHAPPSIGLRDAMALAAERDRIARQYRDGFADLFDTALPALGVIPRPVSGAAHAAVSTDAAGSLPLRPDAPTVAAVQRLYLALLATWSDSHIVRKHGLAAAHTVMAAAQRLRALAGGAGFDAALGRWDDELKAARINPGTTADLTVTALLIASLVEPG